ncbi:MAG: dTDP-4-dehydrorhamnose reductase [Eubacteriales bacterium]|nr:dTDP-4-dehydrorhamnose reductase [Eubacteriales bacterium]
MYLITGVGGQLGHDLMNELNNRGFEAVGTDILSPEAYGERMEALGETAHSYVNCDITDAAAVKALFDATKPDKVIHCAAWTAVDAAEDEENKEKVYAINVTGTENIARCCSEYDIPLTYLSTDYVFNGQGDKPWEPDCKEYEPLNYYGETKLLGEKAVSKLSKFFIVRIAWVFGRNGNNFIKTMIRLSENHDSLRVVCDQIGTPTYTYDLARLLVDINETERYGFYHATNEGGYISWYDFACEIFRQAGIEKMTVSPVTTSEYGLSKAMRPFNSRLNKSKLIKEGFEPLPTWQDALGRYLREMGFVK